MDYRKIGQGINSSRPADKGPLESPAIPSLVEKPLDELGLVGLVERLALAIKRTS